MEKIIYAVAAETIWTPKGVVPQVPGRMSAQFGHALSRMRMHRISAYAMAQINKGVQFGDLLDNLDKMADEGITTIHLSCRDGKELLHVARLLKQRKVRFWDFIDSNLDVYGPGGFVTALATVPVRKVQVEGILDYLPLFAKDLVKG